MRKTTKIWLIAATVLLLAGALLFGGVMAFLKWDFLKLGTDRFETNTHELTDEIRSIDVRTNEADIALLPSDTDACRVVCYENVLVKHAVEVKDGTLSIRAEDTRKWYHRIGFSFHHPTVTVYLPQGQYEALTVKGNTGDVAIPAELGFAGIDVEVRTGDVKNYASATGDIRISAGTGGILVERVSCHSLSLTVSTGDISAASVVCAGDASVTVSTGDTHLTDLSCGDLSTTGNTGDLFLKNVVAAGRLSAERSTGDMYLDSCDAAEIFILTDTGDVEGTLRTEKIFMTKSDTGDIEVPKTVTGGRCEITTDTGDIRIGILSPVG
jgi:DUF4097 and DUF4098 domain-containing protein YvlB